MVKKSTKKRVPVHSNAKCIHLGKIKRSDNLKRHEPACRENPVNVPRFIFRCETCGRTFRDQHDLTKHTGKKKKCGGEYFRNLKKKTNVSMYIQCIYFENKNPYIITLHPTPSPQSMELTNIVVNPPLTSMKLAWL